MKTYLGEILRLMILIAATMIIGLCFLRSCDSQEPAPPPPIPRMETPLKIPNNNINPKSP